MKIPVLLTLLVTFVVPLPIVILEPDIFEFIFVLGFETLIEVEGFDIVVFGCFIEVFFGFVDILTFDFGFDGIDGFILFFFFVIFLDGGVSPSIILFCSILNSSFWESSESSSSSFAFDFELNFLLVSFGFSFSSESSSNFTFSSFAFGFFKIVFGFSFNFISFSFSPFLSFSSISSVSPFLSSFSSSILSLDSWYFNKAIFNIEFALRYFFLSSAGSVSINVWIFSKNLFINSSSSFPKIALANFLHFLTGTKISSSSCP